MVNEIIKKTGANEILFVCKTGSSLFCSNCKDFDYWAVVDNNPNEVHQFMIDGTDIFVLTLEEFKSRVSFEDRTLGMYNLSLEFSKQSGNTVYGHCPVSFDWFSHKKEAIKACIEIGDKSFFHERVFGLNGGSQKNIVWAFATYYAIINNSIYFTAEQKEQLQLCHDGLMPKEKAYELREKLVGLYNEFT